MKSFRNLARFTYQLVLSALTCLYILVLAPGALAAHEDVDFSERELDQMLAPIALYPDTLLSQVLIASTYPLEVIQADRWVRSNKDLKTEDALKFAEGKDWDPSVKALVAFPDLLKRMSEDVDWTQRLGDAFLSDEEAVMDSVQRLRQKARAAGNLDKAQYIRVEEEDDEIIIEPAQERIVYVPVYDTRVVYGSWWYPDYPPVYWHYPSTYVYSYGFYWGPSIYVGSSYFYSSCHWRDRRVVVIDRTRYSSSRFYTGRSIVHHEGAQRWRHNPVHRQGVAYYNDNLRRTYNSDRPARYTDRFYRDSDRSNRAQHDRRDIPNPGGNQDRTFRDHRQPNQAGENRVPVKVNRPEDNSRLQRIKTADTIQPTESAQNDGQTVINQPSNNTIDLSNGSQDKDRAEQLRERMERRQLDNRQWQRREDNDQSRVTNLGTRDSTPAFNRTPETDRYVPGQGNNATYRNNDNNQSRLERTQERSERHEQFNNDRHNNRAVDLTPPPRPQAQEVRQRPEGGSRLERIKRSDDKN
jgi:hypothetical protein